MMTPRPCESGLPPASVRWPRHVRTAGRLGVALLAALGVARAGAAPPPVCSLTLESRPTEPDTLRLRVHHAPGTGACRIASDTLRTALAAALDRPEVFAAGEGSVALGRLIDYAPLACALAATAAADPGWNRRRGRARDGSGDNAWTARTLARPALLGGLVPDGWALVSVSTEKVLKGVPARQVPGCDVTMNGLPFDAQVWVRLRRRPAP